MKQKTVPSPAAILVTPGQVKAYRLRRGWHQTTAALRWGVSERTVRRWETGESYPPPLVCEMILGRQPPPTLTVSLARRPRR